MSTSFQRARSDEQREIRRRTILDAAAAMLREMPVADVSLNELSRRAGLAKSNVLRYFDSREGVLLDLLASLVGDWLDALASDLDSAVDPAATFEVRAEQLAGAFARTLAARPVLCDLMGAQASVLERNVSAEAIAGHKRAGLADARRLAGLLLGALPELTADRAWSLTMGAGLMISAIWTHATPPQALLDAFEQDPELAAMRLEFVPTLERYLVTLAVGLGAQGRAGGP